MKDVDFSRMQARGAVHTFVIHPATTHTEHNAGQRNGDARGGGCPSRLAAAFLPGQSPGSSRNLSQGNRS